MRTNFFTGIDALVLYGGHGMVRRLEVARDERTVLMERVVPGETLWRAPIDVALQDVVSVMTELRTPPPNHHTFPDVRAYHRAWPDHGSTLWRPGTDQSGLLEIGSRLFLEPCDTSTAHVVLHGDLHYGNVLSSDRARWLAIDPKGVTGEPCYDVGDLFRNRVSELYEAPNAIEAMRWRVEALADLAASIESASARGPWRRPCAPRFGRRTTPPELRTWTCERPDFSTRLVRSASCAAVREGNQPEFSFEERPAA